MLAPPSLNFGLTLRNENRYPKRRGFCPCSSASCVPDQTWRFIGGIDTDTISRNSALRSAVPKKFFFPAEHQSEGGHDPSKAIRARFSPAPITGEARSNRCGRDIYICIVWIVSLGKNLFVAIWPATASKGSSFIGRSERDELFGKFLRFS